MRRKEIVSVGSNTMKPVFAFEEAGFPDYIMETIKMQGFTEPTAIQSQVCMCVHVCVYAHVRVCECVCACAHVCVQLASMYVRTYVYIYMCVCVCVCVCVCSL